MASLLRVSFALVTLAFASSSFCISLPATQVAELCANAEDQAHCGRLIEEVQLKRLPGLAVRDGDDLKISLFPTGVTTFRDSVAISGAKSFTLWDYLDRINAVVLFATDGDQTGFVLLQRANGKQYRLPAEPTLSPDRQHLVTVDICAKICDGEVAVWRVTRDDVVKELAWKPQPPWSDANAIWVDADTIRFDYTMGGEERRKQDRRLNDAVWIRSSR
ncbi:MAG TPA: hypothetical protein VGL25_09280 [Casimicrobiaceae bacterium]|jgi:hypothetical protein